MSAWVGVGCNASLWYENANTSGIMNVTLRSNIRTAFYECEVSNTVRTSFYLTLKTPCRWFRVRTRRCAGDSFDIEFTVKIGSLTLIPVLYNSKAIRLYQSKNYNSQGDFQHRLFSAKCGQVSQLYKSLSHEHAFNDVWGKGWRGNNCRLGIIKLMEVLPKCRKKGEILTDSNRSFQIKLNGLCWTVCCNNRWIKTLFSSRWKNAPSLLIENQNNKNPITERNTFGCLNRNTFLSKSFCTSLRMWRLKLIITQ